MAAGQRKKLRVQPTFAYDPVDEHNNFLEHIDDNELFVNDPADTSTDSSSESDDSGNNDNTREITEEIIENKRIRQEIRAKNEANTDTEEYINPVDQYKPEDLYAEKAPIGALPQKAQSNSRPHSKPEGPG